MKKILMVWLIFCGNLSAQESAIQVRPKISLKVQSRVNLDFNRGKTLGLDGIFPALIYKTKKGRIHQFDVSELDMKRTSDVELNQTNLNFVSSYEYSSPLKLLKNKAALTPYIGMGVSVAARHNETLPLSSIEFRQLFSSYLADFYIIPQVQRDLGKGFFTDIALLIYLGEVGISHQVNENPSLPLRNQFTTIGEVDFYKGRKYALRLGFGLRI